MKSIPHGMLSISFCIGREFAYLLTITRGLCKVLMICHYQTMHLRYIIHVQNLWFLFPSSLPLIRPAAHRRRWIHGIRVRPSWEKVPCADSEEELHHWMHLDTMRRGENSRLIITMTLITILVVKCNMEYEQKQQFQFFDNATTCS